MFCDALTIKADITPSYVPGANTITFRTLIRNTSTDTTISQVNVNLPSTYTAISVAGSAFSSGTWTSVAPATGFDLSFALSSGTPLATTTGWARIDVTATTPASASTDWQFQACANVGCTGNAQTRDQDNQSMVLVDATPPGDRYTSDFRTGTGAGDGTTTPVLRNGNPTTLFLRITSAAGSNNSTKYTSIALPLCFGTPTGVSLTGGTGYTVTTRDGFIILAGGNLGNVGNFMTVQFTATPTGCANGTTTFLSSVSSNQTDDANTSNAVVAISGNYASVSMDSTKPTVTINQAATQSDPTNSSPINFTAVFSEPVTGFTGSDVSLSGTAGATTAVVTGSGTTYNVAVSGMTSDGTVIASIPAGGDSPSTRGAQDAAGNGNTASTSTDNTVSYDTTKPNVTINQASGQADPTSVSPIHFTAVFNEPVTGFTNTDVTIAGTAGGTKTVAVTEVAPNNGTTYDVAVSGMTQRGTVVATIPAGSTAPSTSGAQDAAGNGNNASTSTDNTVTWDRLPAAMTPSFNPASPKTNDLLQASTTTSDPDGDNIAVAWTWKVTRGANTCTIKTESSASAAAGLRTVSLDLSQSYPTSACTGASPPVSINPSKSDVVSASATPNDGLLDGSTQSNTVTIQNTAPTVTLAAANDLTVNEGSTHTYSYTISDPDGDTIASVSTSCGLHGTKSNPSNTNAAGQFDCTFPDGPDSSTATAQATDSGFGAIAGNTAFQAVTINNVAPTVAFTSAPASANEGQTKTYTYSISDPGQDTVQSVATNCGASGTKSNASNTNTSGTFDCAFPDGDASSNVSVQPTDSDGEAGNTAMQPVTINNIAPSITISGNSSVDEGSTYTLNVGAIADPGQDTISDYVVHWGDGNSNIYNSNGVKTHIYADGPDDHAITVDLVDEDGTFFDRANPLSVHVNNVAPTIAISGNANVNEGASYSLAPGTWLGPYQVLGPLGAGGMGEVYVAEIGRASCRERV